MPKMKSKRGAVKRFEVTGSGKIIRRKSRMRHKLTHKSSRVKRNLSMEVEVSPAVKNKIKRLILA
ncbi:MAG: 50S ribosomal protein L35 [bacterium]|nr:50S ribosomal protein L35 [bacterium]